ncbi:ScbA/BarX family gamma-butyrolactone biosynthesis protein [Streptomyces sp. MS1.HAVA.3]|uniref:ScbA/BarX family gamma-butyrolactone biosynthesis protein n=1 Tax=Streptomyces caledonius TaxID=3134107 RepID=A0ABU8U3S8_9ACTN
MATITLGDRTRHIGQPSGVVVQQGTRATAARRSNSQLVSEQLVHRTSAADVLPTGWTRLGGDRFLVLARWPHDHPSFRPVAGLPSPILISETLRQTAMMLAHAEFGVPLGHHFVMWDITHVAHPERLPAGTAPAEVTVEVTCSDVRRRGSGLAGMDCHMDIRSRGRIVASGGGALTVTSPAAYRRLRAERLDDRLPTAPPPPAPEFAGVLDAREVMLAPAAEPGRWQLRTDRRHPAVLGRSNDHYPGMVLMSAAHQAAHAVADSFYPAYSSIRFSRYAEFSSPCWVEAQPAPSEGAGTAAVRVTGRQDEQLVFLAQLAATAPTV